MPVASAVPAATPHYQFLNICRQMLSSTFCDDLGYVQQSPDEAEVLFTLLAERYERRSVMVTQQPGVQPVGPDLPRPDGHRRGDRPPGTPLGWCLSSTCRAIERTRCDRRHRHRLHRRRLVDGHGVRCCRGATDPLLPETCVVQDIGELAVLPAFRWRPKAPAAFRQSSRRCGAERRIRARPSVNAHPDVVRARERRLQARLAQQPPPIVPTVVACARRAFRGTRVVARRNALSGSSSSITPSGPTRPFRLARVPRPGMTNTDVRLGTQPGDRTRQGPRYARNITSRTLSRTNAHAYIDADVPAAPRSSTPGGSGRGTVPRVAGRVAGIARRVRDRGVARAGLRSGSAGTGDCRSDQRLRA